MRKMTKVEMVRVISDETGLSRKDTREVLESLFSHIAYEMVSGGKFVMQGFGTFEAVPRTVHYVKGGIHYEEEMPVPVFHAGEELKRICRRV